MPSANLSGRPSATRPEHVEEDFGYDFPVLDGGVCLKGARVDDSSFSRFRMGHCTIRSFVSRNF